VGTTQSEGCFVLEQVIGFKFASGRQNLYVDVLNERSTCVADCHVNLAELSDPLHEWKTTSISVAANQQLHAARAVRASHVYIRHVQFI